MLSSMPNNERTNELWSGVQARIGRHLALHWRKLRVTDTDRRTDGDSSLLVKCWRKPPRGAGVTKIKVNIA